MAYTKIEIGLYAVDVLWNLCVVFPVLVTFWSGTWTLVDFYMDSLFPNQEFVSNGLSIVIGSAVLVVVYFVFPLLKGLIVVSWRSLTHVVVSRVSIYICASASLFMWRGVWNIVSGQLGNNFLAAMVTTVVAIVLLILLKSSAMPIGSPFALHRDTHQDFYGTYPRFRHQMDTLWLYILDVVFSVYIVTALTVVAWVGLWKVGDALILPNDIKRSLVVSLIAGYGCSLVAFALWLLLRPVINRLYASSRITAHVIEVAFNVVSVVVVLLLWRGLWGLMQRCLEEAANSLTIAWILHAVGFLAMTGLQVGRTFGSVGCVVDGEKPFEDWPMEYFIVLYRSRRNELQASRTIIQSYSECESEAEQPLLSSGRNCQQSVT